MMRRTFTHEAGIPALALVGRLSSSRTRADWWVAVSVALIAALVIALTLGAAREASAASTTKCPSGSNYNGKTKKCEVVPTTGCPIGAGDESISNYCFTSDPLCDSPGEVDRSYASTCSYYLPQAETACAEGYTLEMRNGDTLGQCMAPTNYSCPTGTREIDNRCGGPLLTICPTTFDYNATSGMCETSASTNGRP